MTLPSVGLVTEESVDCGRMLFADMLTQMILPHRLRRTATKGATLDGAGEGMIKRMAAARKHVRWAAGLRRARNDRALKAVV